MNSYVLDMANERSIRQRASRKRYTPPHIRADIPLSDLLERSGRLQLQETQLDLLKSADNRSAAKDVTIYFSGRLELLQRPAVAIVGTRKVSEAGHARTVRLARELVEAGVTVVSGLARGVDSAAHLSTIESGGSAVAVIGTPLSQSYPAANSQLQELIYRRHLLLTPFADGERVFRSNFPKRNRVMAAVSDATVIMEASDSSGTLHQAAECQRLGRWLFIANSVASDPSLTWPASFLGHRKTRVLRSTDDLIEAISHD